MGMVFSDAAPTLHGGNTASKAIINGKVDRGISAIQRQKTVIIPLNGRLLANLNPPWRSAYNLPPESSQSAVPEKFLII